MTAVYFSLGALGFVFTLAFAIVFISAQRRVIQADILSDEKRRQRVIDSVKQQRQGANLWWMAALFIYSVMIVISIIDVSVGVTIG